jgi:phosphoglycerol transferase
MKGLLQRVGLSIAVLSLGLPLLALVAWIPTLLSLGSTSFDQVAESFGIATACQPGRFLLGWLGDVAPPPAASLSWIDLVPARAVPWLSCQLSLHSPLSPAQSFLLLGLSLTFVLALVACRRARFRLDTSLVVAFVITTAPSSFSRIGHLSLSMLWPIIPGLLACHGLWRAMQVRRIGWPVLGAGALAGLLCYPAQDYYIVFLILQILACFGLLLFLATTRTIELACLGRIAGAGALFVVGFVAVMVWAESPNLLGVAAAGPPGSWVMPRSPNMQFLYGLLPFTWLIPPPWIEAVNQAFVQSGVATGTESYWRSSGSLLIPIAWLVGLWQLARRHYRSEPPDGQPTAIPFFALLLALVTFLGLFWMTMGGMGTLFAVVVSPVLRSLNRYTVFVFGASVLLLASLLDASLRRRFP